MYDIIVIQKVVIVRLKYFSKKKFVILYLESDFKISLTNLSICCVL